MSDQSRVVQTQKAGYRNSSLEMLRIVAMLIIIVHHFGVHGIFIGPLGTERTFGLFSWQVLFTQLVCWGGSLGNSLFVIITGYFMVDREQRWKKLGMLLATMFFYSWVIEAIVYGGGFLQPTGKSVLHMSIPILFGENWFISCYLIFSLFIPFYNCLLNTMPKKMYEKFLLLLFFVVIVFPAAKFETFLHGNMAFFALVYACGGYLKLYGSDLIEVRLREKYLRYFMALVVITLATIVLQDALAFLLHKERMIGSGGTKVASLLYIPMAMSLFGYFLTRPDFYSPWVNKIAGTVPGIYLIHDNALMRELIWNHIFPNLDMISSPWYVLFYGGKVLAVFAVCSGIDLMRKRWIEPVFDRKLDRWTFVIERRGQAMQEALSKYIFK